MRICHVSARLPPDVGASAIQTAQIASWCRAVGDEVQFLTYGRPERPGRRPSSTAALPGSVVAVSPPRAASPAIGAIRVAGLACAARVAREAARLADWADLIHVHGASTLAQVSALVAMRQQKPVVLTVYGPEIWNYRPARWVAGGFARAYRGATHVTFTSHGLLARAVEQGLGRRDVTVVYPPVSSAFGNLDEHWRAAARGALGVRARHLLVCVRALDATGGQVVLIEAMSEVIRTHPDTRLVLIGTGPELPDLKLAARAWGVEGHVTFAGCVNHDVVAQYDAAADVFLLPSTAESLPVAALEALACGCPVIASDSDGGLELHELFGFDVSIVPRGHAATLARAIVHTLEAKRRVRQAVTEAIDREYRCDVACGHYRTIYEHACAPGAPAVTGG